MKVKIHYEERIDVFSDVIFWSLVTRKVDNIYKAFAVLCFPYDGIREVDISDSIKVTSLDIN